MTSPFSFRPCHRLRSTADFERVYRAGRRAGDGIFAINAAGNDTGFARLGMSVSTRTAGNSVRRNRVRRIIREVFRLSQPLLPALDYVVTSRPGARTADRPALVTSLERLFAEAAAKLGAPPARH